MATRRNQGNLLARVNFPLYTIQMLTSRHVLVGGGGGESKTGVANGFEIFEVSHDGWNFIAEEITRHETGLNVVMNSASFNDGKRNFLVAGQENYCQLYNVTSRVVTLENGKILKGTSASAISKENLRQRRKSERNDEKINSPIEKVEEVKDNNNANIKHKRLQLILKPSTSVETDFSKNEEPRQRVVRISSNGKIMATGGIDGIIRIWKFPQMEKIHELKAHTKEIDDIDFNLSGNLVATISKDRRALIWDVVKGTKNQELTWNTPNEVKYMYKRLRFRIPDDEKSKTQLFMLSNAIVPKNSNFLQLWDIEQGIIVKSTSFKETLSALAVSDDGKFVAVGTMFTGTVDIFIAFSLQRVLHVPGAHSMFITGLEFLRTKLEGPAITSNAEAAVISISVDNRICIHSIPFRHTLPFWLVIVFIILSICGAFMFCSYMGI